jgi:hypothetical protein
MNPATHYPHASEVSKPGRKGKTFARQITVGDSDFMEEIKRAFDLAKSSGQELDLTFSRRPEGRPA